MFCTKCGSRLSEGARFCAQCGAEVSNTVSASQKAEMPDQSSAKTTQNSEMLKVAETVAAPEAFTNPTPAELVSSEPAPAEPTAEEPAPTEFTPAEPAPVVFAAASEASKPKRTRVKKKANKVAAVLWCILLALSMLMTGVMGVFYCSTTPEAIETMLSTVELAEIALTDTSGDRVDLTKLVYDSIDAPTKEKYGLTEKDIEDLLEDIDWKTPAAELATQYISCYISGAEFTIRADDIVEIIEDNEREIAQATNGFRFDYDKLEEIIEDNVMKYIEPDELSEMIGFDVTMASTATVVMTNAIFVVLLVLSLVMVFYSHRFNVLPALGYIGMTLGVLGLIMLVSSFVCSIFLQSLLPAAFLVPIVSVPVDYAKMIFGGVFGIGLLMYIPSRVLRNIRSKRA